MQCRYLLSVLVLLAVAADSRKENETKKDMTKIQGTWAFVTIEEQGSRKSERELKGLEDRLNWTFAGNEVVRNLGMEAAKGKFKLDATKEPKEIDLFDYAGKGKTVLGIYTFHGEQLTMSLGSPKGTDRPANFDSRPKSGQANFLLKRHVVKNLDS